MRRSVRRVCIASSPMNDQMRPPRFKSFFWKSVYIIFSPCGREILSNLRFFSIIFSKQCLILRPKRPIIPAARSSSGKTASLSVYIYPAKPASVAASSHMPSFPLPAPMANTNESAPHKAYTARPALPRLPCRSCGAAGAAHRTARPSPRPSRTPAPAQAPARRLRSPSQPNRRDHSECGSAGSS